MELKLYCCLSINADDNDIMQYLVHPVWNVLDGIAYQ